MNRAVVAFILLFSALLLCFGSSRYARTQMEETVSRLETMKEDVAQKDFSAAYEKSLALQKSWELHHRILCTYISHDRLEKVDEDLIAMRSFILFEEEAHVLSQCDRVISQITDLLEGESLSLENIL